jgi:alpha 1,2-mannosyltransferase
MWKMFQTSPLQNYLSSGQGYNGIHFWSNFEIADFRFFRGAEYRALFDHLDHAGGFFYERWGDAPVHTLAVAALLEKKQVHYFGG